MNSRAALSVLAVFLLAALVPGAAPPAPVRFSRDILPILSAQCFQCHGPDAHARKAKLRLDTHDGALGVITPGKVAESELIRRITSKDDDERMPPPTTNHVLTAAEKDALRRWVEQGAPWGRHWAYETPERPAVPGISNPGPQIRNPIDAFVVDRLRAEGLKPSPEATRESLIRRVTFDLTGLPPTPDEIDAFTADQSPNAYERIVDRLLASPRYGERQAVDWLDIARFADSNGYQNDFARTMWPWRDWVIAAFNRNQPFDQFVIEQMAGDLLPNATRDQRIATGFNRNNRTVTEAGSIDEEWRIENAVDRVETTSAAFLGLTVGCCRCHDHKFDPISQREFYQFLAFFNSVNEKGVYVEKPGNVPPLIPVQTSENERRLKELDAAIAAVEKAEREQEAALPKRQRNWEVELRTRVHSVDPRDWAVRIALDGNFDIQAADSPRKAIDRGVGQPTWADSAFGKALRFDGKDGAFVDAGPVAAATDRTKPVSYGAWVKPRGSGAVLSKMEDAAGNRGFDLLLTRAEGALPARRVQVHMIHHWPDNALKVTTRDSVPADVWSHVFVTYDASGKAAGLAIYINGRRAELRIESDSLTSPIDTPEPLRLCGRAASLALNGDLADVRIYSRTLPATEVQAAAFQPLKHVLDLPPDRRPAAGQALLDEVYRAAYATEWRDAKAQVNGARAAKSAYEKTIPTTMVMEDLPKPRPTYLLKRGQYDQPDKAQPVEPGVPACLPPLTQENEKPRPANRLDLARWLVDPANPLTARVAVNRFWQQFFGAGLVKTSEDFGVRGELPSHPMLLDWLATEFVASGWDVKRLQRLIVTSATYRQSSTSSPDMLLRDPENRLLARGPRFRLPAESVRDAALAVGGLLAEHVGGPSVKPYQPVGLWEELAGGAGEGKYVQDTGANLYRRSLYVYRKRTVPHPELATLDAPSREVCQVKRSQTNTPMQALQLLNDVTYVEAARHLAHRMLTDGGRIDADRIAFGFRLATARRPTAGERAVLMRGLERYRRSYGDDHQAAKRLVRNGDSPVDETLDPAEFAAYQAVAAVILNLNETITRE